MHTSMNRLMLGVASVAMTVLGAVGAASAATTVNLTARPVTAAMPDGASIPMWGYCGTVASTDSGAVPIGGSCSSATWAPGPTLVVKAGDSLTIVLTNNLHVATSVTILGQIGGGLGTPQRDAAPFDHSPAVVQGTTGPGTTWPVTGGSSSFSPPAQPTLRANSFVPVTAPGTTSTSTQYTWSNLKPGTYLYETGTRPSLQAPMGLYGVLVVTTSPTLTAGAITAAGTAFPLIAATKGAAGQGAVTYDSDAAFLISEIDAVQNTAVDSAATYAFTHNTAAGWETTKWTPTCAAPCYPPAVNYAPTYVLLNGQPFDATNPGGNSVQPQVLGVASGTAATTGNVMLRVVNAGLRTHVPSLVGLPKQMQQIAEDGNRAPGLPQAVSELLMTAGKTRDVLITPASTVTTAGTTSTTTFTEAAYGFFDRALGLSTNNRPNGGAQGYLAIVNPSTLTTQTLNAWLGSAAGGKAAAVTPTAVADNFFVQLTAATFAGNVISNDIGITTVAIQSGNGLGPTKGTVSLNSNGTFTYTPTGGVWAADSFNYCGNGGTAAPLCTTVSLALPATATVVANGETYTSRVATVFRAWAGEGVLANDTDSQGYPLTASLVPGSSTCTQLTLNPDGSFVATSNGSNCSFTYNATDSQGAKSAAAATVNVTFAKPAGYMSGLAVNVTDALGLKQGALPTDISLTDYMWVIEEDPTFHTLPGVTPPPDTTGLNAGNPALTISNSFHVSHTPIVAAGCTGPLSCGDAQTIGGPKSHAPAVARSLPKDVYLDPTKHYFISVLPGDAGNAFIAGLSGDPTVPGNCTFSNTNVPNMKAGKSTDCGHTIGGAQIANVCAPGAATCTGSFAPVTVLVDPNPLKPSQLSILAFEDNNPINGDLDDGETGLGGFNIVIFDAAGRSGDPAGQITYDAFNMPLTNWLLGKPGCPNEENPTVGGNSALKASGQSDLVGMIYTCPDGHRNITNIALSKNGRTATVTTSTPHGFTSGTAVDLSGIDGSALFNGTFTVGAVKGNTFQIPVPAGFTGSASVHVGKGASARDPATYSLAGHALVKNIMPGRFDVLMHPSAARQGDGENWIQVSTLEGTPANDAFARAGEPAYFQEFGPPGYHAFVGWMNPDRIQSVNSLVGVKGNQITGRVTNIHMSRPSQIFNYDSTTRDPLKSTVCYVGLNTTGGNGATAAFAKCDDKGNFTLNDVPAGSHQVVVWDQWLDQIIAYFNVNVPAQSTPVTIPLGDLPVLSWFTMVQEHAFVYNDAGCPAAAMIAAAGSQAALNDPSLKAGTLKACATTDLAQIPITIRFRDGSISNLLQTDSNGIAAFNELFPLFNWYVAEVDQTRYAPLTAHVVVDGGGQPDCTTFNSATGGSTATSGCTSVGGLNPGVVTSTYPADPGATPQSTEHTYTNGELYFGLQGFISQTEKIDWGKTVLPQDGVTNGGFSGTIVYASTRGFDDPHLEVQFKWEPLIPRVPVHLYQKVTAPDGTTALKLVAVTTSTSWDDVAAGTYSDLVHNPLQVGKPSCPGQTTTDPYRLQVLGQDTNRCYDGFHNWNQVQPLTYDGYYQFPTMYPNGVTLDGTPINNADGTTPPAVPIINGQYVIEIVPPPGYEVVKEEDKNILIGDAWVAPPAQQFAALSNIFIQPDQAAISSAYNLNGAGSLQNLLDFVDGSPQLPLCSGTLHRVPDFLSLFPNSSQIAPFAGADRPLCDRKDVQIMAGQNGTANFFVYSNTPRAAKFTGIILDDASAEFNVAAPDFGEKFGVPYVAVSIRDQYGIEIERMYGDQWGGYNGMTPSSWQVNVPNPAGYSPNMLVTCMNDPGPVTIGGITQIDPQYMPSYSNFCYTNPFMPGLTTYLDTPVLPVGAFASNYVSGYNPVDCAYPDATPAISRVDTDVGPGPWMPAGGHTLKIKALGTVNVPNAAYLGPSQDGTTVQGQKTTPRKYSFGATPGKVLLSNSSGSIDITPAGSGWSDLEIDALVPGGQGGVKPGSYELSITNANGQTSVDTVTVTIEPARAATLSTPASPIILTAPSNSVVAGGASHVIQNAIDNAKPGDLIILNAGVYNELVVMWKPVRLQGVGAASVIINAAKYPTDKLEAWRPTINNLFGVDTISGNASANPQVDPLPGQEITGGIVFLEPSVLATEEGAGITVLAKNRGEGECGEQSLFSDYYDSTTIRYVNGVPEGTPTTSKTHRMSDSYFDCHPSRIDGISVTGGDAGGGIYVNGYAHNLEIANNRVYGNAGAFGGGIRVGVPHLETQDLAPITVGFNNNINIHHNSITQNGLIEASGAVGGTPGASGAGAGLSLCTGTNSYKANYNFVCGNYSSSDGGGIGHIGWSSGGTIANNTILFNQSFFQQSATNGGGIAIEGDAAAAGGLTLGSGPGLVVDSNLVQGNFAQGGHGGGIALMQVNGSDTLCSNSKCSYANQVTVTNNMIVDNVAGWSAGGLYLQDSFNVNVVNNTVAMNDSVGIAGPLFGANNHGTPHAAGIAVDATSPALQTPGFKGVPAVSYPASLENNIVWHNRSFYGNLFGTQNPPNNVGLQGTATTYYSNAQLCSSNDAGTITSTCVAPPYVLTSTTTALQTIATGQCGTSSNERYWDVGLVSDTSAVPAANAPKLNPQYSVLTSTVGYTGANNTQVDPVMKKTYCNSAQAISASSDEQGNFVDFRYGPLTQTAPVGLATPIPGTAAGGTDPGTLFGNYVLTDTVTSASAYNTGTSSGPVPGNDFVGTKRPQAGAYDIGAFELVAPPVAVASVTGGPLAFGSVVDTTTSASKTVTLSNTGNATLTGITLTFSATTFSRAAAGGTCGTTLAANTTCTINVVFAPTAATSSNETLTIGGNVAITGSPVSLTGTGVAAVTSATLTPANWSPSQTRNCPGTTFAQILACAGDPTKAFTLTNTGNVPLTGIARGTLSATSSPDYSIVRLLSNCGPNGGGQLAGVTTLQAGGTCSIVVQFKPRTSDAANSAQNGTVSVADAAGTQSSTLTGTAK